MNDSFLFQLRDLARTEPNARMRNLLKGAADKLDLALKQAVLMPTRAAMQDLNGCWAFAERVLKEVTRPDDGGSAGRMEVPLQRRAA